MNKTFNDVTILGKIIFSDGEVTSAKSMSNVEAFERNTIQGTTSLLQDDLLVNHSIRALATVESSEVRSNGVVFKNDIDEDGLPIVQTRGFSEIIRNQILESKEKIDQMIPDIIDPPNKRIRLLDSSSGIEVKLESGNISMGLEAAPTMNLSSTAITIGNENSTQSNRIEVASSTMTSFDSGYYSQITPDYIKISDNYGTIKTVIMDADKVQITGATGEPTTQITKNYVQLRNGFLYDTYYQGDQIYANSDFTIETLDHVLRFNTGMSVKIHYFNYDHQFIERYMSHVVCEGVGTCRLKQFQEYSGISFDLGWTCFVTNFNGADLQIIPEGMEDWVCHSNGLSSSPIIIKKWSTVKISLLQLPNYGRVWAVGQF